MLENGLPDQVCTWEIIDFNRFFCRFEFLIIWGTSPTDEQSD